SERGGLGFGKCLIALVLAVVLYVLGSGPLLRLCLYHHVPACIFRTAYAPALFAMNYNQAAGRFFAWYWMQVWRMPYFRLRDFPG
ncbi:MAG TPA: hypothetical protein VLT36_12870, partial [Candidatus Dormibacteraeota bacterium]|nr:hypothetical protein [Candidatus Dormibacteraeota bacterium]